MSALISTRLRRAFGPVELAALLVLAALILGAAFGPWLIPTDPIAQDIGNMLLPPGAPGHLLGTDELGRDVLTRLIYGARVELVVALGASCLAMVLGVTLGLLGGYLGGIVEMVSMRLVDIILSFPPFIVALLFITIYGPGQGTLIVLLGVMLAPTFARLVYGQTLTVKRLEYVQAAVAFGASLPTRLFTVVLPNVAVPIIVQFPITMAIAILTESGLSYLGIGIVPPTPSWGGMVASGQRFVSQDLWLIIIPGTAIVLTVLSFGLLGNALQYWLDARSAGDRR